MRRMFIAALIAVPVLSPSRALATDPRVWFDQAVSADLRGVGAGSSAFALYRQAAEAGLPEAELNIGIMLDSGRGVHPDLAQAATWYARAAARGNQRAAYNLGQLYEAGQGVPRNAGLAHAWFRMSRLPAARDHLASADERPIGALLTRATLVFPTAGAKVPLERGTVEFVWTSQAQPGPVRFFIELRALDAPESHEVFSGSVDVSSVVAAVPDVERDYAWRVLTLAPKLGRYVTSDWVRFDTVANSDATMSAMKGVAPPVEDSNQ